MRALDAVLVASIVWVVGCGKTPEEASIDLLAAVQAGDLGAVRGALQAGGDANARDEQGESALRKATTGGAVDIVEVLLEAGADPNATDGQGDPAREIAFTEGTMTMIRLFAEAGADVSPGSPGTAMALWRASEKCDGSTLRVLLGAGASPDAEAEEGKGALWIAAYEGCDEAVELLLAAGANADGLPGPLYDPDGEAMTQRAPDGFRGRFETSVGDFLVEVRREWAPLGADRFYNLVRNGFYDGQRFFRVIPGALVQWGIHGDPAVSAKWRRAAFRDDPVRLSNVRGTVCFATAGPDSRVTQVFVNLRNNSELDDQGFAPFGQVVEGMDVVEAVNTYYGEEPRQKWIESHGDKYLEREFPELDYIERASLED